MDDNSMHQLRIAVSQFPVSDDLLANEAYIVRHMESAQRKGASVVHFPETALSGYETRIGDLDWPRVDESLQRIRLLADRLDVCVILGVHEQGPRDRKPFNSTKVFSSSGEILGTYRKTNIYNQESERFAPGAGLLVLDIDHVRCGFLICYDSCFPDLFRKYEAAGVQLLFLSYHNAGSMNPRNSLNGLMTKQLCTRAADHGIYISASNSCARYSRMPSGVASPDGRFTRQRRHRPGILIYDYPADSLGWTYSTRR